MTLGHKTGYFVVSACGQFVSCSRKAWDRFSGVGWPWELCAEQNAVSVCSLHYVPWGNVTD